MRGPHFRTIVVVDFEFETEGGDFGLKDGDLQEVLCMVAYVLDANLRHVSTIRLWRGEFGPKPPFDIGPDTLVVGYSLQAELMCFLSLNWALPVYVFDLFTAFQSVTNILLPYDPEEARKRPRKRLIEACRAYGIPGWEGLDKPELGKAIGHGRWREIGCAAVLHYCEEDVRVSAELLRRQLAGHGHRAPVDPEAVIRWSHYSAKTVARIQARGMPIDVALWDLVQEHKHQVIAALIRQLDPSQGGPCPIYSPDGEWGTGRFEAWLASVGIFDWPRLDTGALELKRDAFRLMAPAHPTLEGLSALREVIGVIVRARIPIGRDGRNRPSLFPFGAASGRNAQAKSLFNTHAGLRSFMKFPPHKIGLYLDWRTQEVGVGAARSGDVLLMRDYLLGDIYHALALLCGLTRDTNIQRWKNDNKAQRQQMKALQLGIGYGMGVRSLARGLDRHPLIASGVILRHQQRYPTFWAWRANMVEHAMLDRVIVSEFDGWPLHLSHSPNRRTIYNFPAQAGGSEMLRLAANRLCDADLVPSMLVHDGILFELDDDEQVRHAIEIMQKAGTEVCRGLEIGVDRDQELRGGARYRDKREVAVRIWATIMNTLAEIGAVPQPKHVLAGVA
jgi:DNA polymerase I